MQQLLVEAGQRARIFARAATKTGGLAQRTKYSNPHVFSALARVEGVCLGPGKDRIIQISKYSLPKYQDVAVVFPVL